MRYSNDSNGGTYTYDANGNWTKLVSGANTYTFQYDAENHLTYYQSPTGFTTYYYNGMGLRVAENDHGTEHDLLNDGAAPGSSLLIDHNLGTQTTSEVYTPGIDQRDWATDALHIMGVDALGTVRAFINDNMQEGVTDTFGTFAYGIPRNRTGSDAFTFAFAGADGYQTDPNGLVLLGNRVYHPYTGRFLTRDPAGAGDNDYEYADDNPLRFIDPTGLYGEEAEPGSQNSPSAYQNPGYDSSTAMTATDWFLNEYKDGKYDGNTWQIGTTYLGNSSLDTPFTSMAAFAGPRSPHFKTPTEAAIRILKIVYRLMMKETVHEEYGGAIIKAGKYDYYAGYWSVGNETSILLTGQPGEVADYHTHPDGPPGTTTDLFSTADKAGSDLYNIVGYLGAYPDMLEYIPVGITVNLGHI